MTLPHRLHRRSLRALPLVLTLTLACGDQDDAPVATAADPQGGEEPPTAVTHPDSDDVSAVPPAPTPPVPTPTPEPASVEEPAAATDPPQLVLLHAHELLRLEERQIEQLLSALARGSVTLERAPAGDRTAALEAWLAEVDPAARAQMPLARARGSARAVLVLRLAPPVENRAQGVLAFGVIAGEPARERLWAHGDLPSEARAGLAALLAAPPAEGSQP